MTEITETAKIIVPEKPPGTFAEAVLAEHAEQTRISSDRQTKIFGPSYQGNFIGYLGSSGGDGGWAYLENNKSKAVTLTFDDPGNSSFFHGEWRASTLTAASAGTVCAGFFIGLSSNTWRLGSNGYFYVNSGAYYSWPLSYIPGDSGRWLYVGLRNGKQAVQVTLTDP